MDWKKLFAPHILDRGYNYALEDRVFLEKQTDTEITASVQGTEDYEVNIHLDCGRVEYMYCDCPYADSGENCKHMAAVLYVAKPQEQTATQKNHISLRDAVEKLSKDTLQQLLLEQAGISPKLRERIIMLATGKLPKDYKKSWQRDIKRTVRRYSDPSGFVDYENAFILTNELSDYMDLQVEELWTYGFYAEAFELVCFIFQTVADLDIDDSDGGISELLSYCDEWWSHLYEKADHELKQTMHEWFMQAAGTHAKGLLQDTILALF